MASGNLEDNFTVARGFLIEAAMALTAVEQFPLRNAILAFLKETGGLVNPLSSTILDEDIKKVTVWQTTLDGEDITGQNMCPVKNALCDLDCEPGANCGRMASYYDVNGDLK
jgi:hypothetical protein